MIKRYEIIEHGGVRPDAERILFCDGTEATVYCPETDLELSHWRPNHTPEPYRAGTSTEICFRFLDAPRPGPWTAAVNNHVDVDGILSLYVLVHSEHALAHRRVILEAAEMGDFWGWGGPAAQRLFQGITRLMNHGGDPREVYDQAFHRIAGWIEGTDPESAAIDASLAPLRAGHDLVAQGKIIRRPLNDRLTHYIIPLDIAGQDGSRLSYVPGFNELISPRSLLWPQVRACWDAERVCLVSTEREQGWFHDLWYPGYLWADTQGKWLVPGCTFQSMGQYEITNDAILTAFSALQCQEPGLGYWALGGTQRAFGSQLTENFPLVGRVVGEDGEITASQLSPECVAAALRDVFSNGQLELQG